MPDLFARPLLSVKKKKRIRDRVRLPGADLARVAQVEDHARDRDRATRDHRHVPHLLARVSEMAHLEGAIPRGQTGEKNPSSLFFLFFCFSFSRLHRTKSCCPSGGHGGGGRKMRLNLVQPASTGRESAKHHPVQMGSERTGRGYHGGEN